MRNWDLYLANVSWREVNMVGDLIPGHFPVPLFPEAAGDGFEASIPAYSRAAGRDIQLAIKSKAPCSIISPSGEQLALHKYVHPDTGVEWWVEKGNWTERQGGFHDAPTFRHPGGHVDLRIGDVKCRVNVFYPGLTDSDFLLILDDLRTWCWRMAVDEGCYVATDQHSEATVLAGDFLRLVAEFLKHAHSALDLPHSELRESVSMQPIQQLRPNFASLRFLAQKGEQPQVPGRDASPHYATPENCLLYGMLKSVMRMLRPQEALTRGSARRFISTADRYEKRADELRDRTTEKIDPDVLESNLGRARKMRDEVAAQMHEGLDTIKVTSEKDFTGRGWVGGYKGCFALIYAGHDSDLTETLELIEKHGSVRVIGRIDAKTRVSQYGTNYYYCIIEEVIWCGIWRDYAKECETLEAKKKQLEKRSWEQPLPGDVLEERKKEERVLRKRAESLRHAAERMLLDETQLSTLMANANSADRRAAGLGILPNLRFVPSMVFLQTPSYSGALSAYRQLLDLTGLDDAALEALLALEDVGIADWPSIYERWSLVCTLRVLQDELRFAFDREDVRRKLFTYCTGSYSGHLVATGRRADMGIDLVFEYQRKLKNGRVPDFLFSFKDLKSGISANLILDAKSCDFVTRPEDAQRNAYRYLDDCLYELLFVKDYGLGGKNSVFIIHPSNKCVSHPSTMQQWAHDSCYGGDAVFYWEEHSPVHKSGAVSVRPGDTSHLKRLVLLLIQYRLDRTDICPSCGAGGSDIQITEKEGSVGRYCRCKKCSFLSVRSHCYNCKRAIIKNAAWWSYHDLHPTDVWNIKCPTCGSLL